MSEPLVIEQGAIHVYRQYDVADEIDLAKVLAINKQATGRLKLSREGSQYLELPNPPVALLMGHRALTLRDGTHSVELIARLFDHGAVSILLRLPIAPGTSLADLVPLADDVYDNPGIDQLARAEAESVCRTIGAALENPHFWDNSESYHVIFVERFRTAPTAPRASTGT
jgi:hypothetical protein